MIDPLEAAPREPHARRAAMAIAVRANTDELAALVEAVGALDIVTLRAPEIGLAMVRGRIGGDGAPFNLGEATVTRAAVSVHGRIGHGHVLGRHPERARLAATVDALWQDQTHRDVIESGLARIAKRFDAERALSQARTAATRVDFFTMVRGEG